MSKVSTIIFALLIFSMVLVGTGAFYSDISDSYNQTNNNMSDYSYESRTFVSDIAETSETELNSTDGGLASITFSTLGDLVFSAPINILKAFSSGVNAMSSTINSLGVLGLPTWAIEFFLAGFSIVVAFAIINAIWKKEF